MQKPRAVRLLHRDFFFLSSFGANVLELVCVRVCVRRTKAACLIDFTDLNTDAAASVVCRPHLLNADGCLSSHPLRIHTCVLTTRDASCSQNQVRTATHACQRSFSTGLRFLLVASRLESRQQTRLFFRLFFLPGLRHIQNELCKSNKLRVRAANPAVRRLNENN